MRFKKLFCDGALFFLLICVIIYLMGLFTWGSLPKDQTSNQLITEAIDVAIAAHEADPTAHLGDGESLQQHKNNEIIDHPAYSIVDDKMDLTNFVLDVPLNAYDSFVKTVTGFGRPGYIEFSTGATANIFYYADLPSDDRTGWYPSGLKSPRFDIIGGFSSDSNIEAYLGMGDLLGDSAIGFKIVDDFLYAVWWDGDPTEYLIPLISFDPTTQNKYTAIVDYGVDVKYFLNDVLLYTLPWPANIVIASDGICFTFAIKKTSSYVRTMFFNKMLFQQSW